MGSVNILLTYTKYGSLKIINLMAHNILMAQSIPVKKRRKCSTCMGPFFFALASFLALSVSSSPLLLVPNSSSMRFST